LNGLTCWPFVPNRPFAASGKRTLLSLQPVVESVQKEILTGLSSAEYKQFVQLAAKVIASAHTDGGLAQRGMIRVAVDTRRRLDMIFR
jgi:hypothetical protein